MRTLSFISAACNAKIIGQQADKIINDIITDSRLVKSPETLLFACIVTKRNDGHQYIGAAYQQGVRSFLITKEIDQSQYPESCFLLVKDTVAALQLIAIAVRKQSNVPVIGITGSNGKTIIKEWLNHLLSDSFNIVRSPKSYNSQIGVALSVWQMMETHNLGIFEAGISEPGEMALLEKMIQPSIGIFTNIGEAHNQGFVNTRQKINEKLSLFTHTKSLIYCSDYYELNEAIAQFAHNRKTNDSNDLALFSWSYKHDATLRITTILKQDGQTNIEGVYNKQNTAIKIPFTDAASIENAINCWCLLLLLNIAQQKVVDGMASLKPIAMRLEMLQGDNNCLLINDTYNADLRSLRIALDMLAQQKQHTSQTLILSDLYQTGMTEEALYTEVAAIIADQKINRFIGVGTSLMRHRHLFERNKNMETLFFPDTQSLLKQVYSFNFNNEAILLKASRSFTFEKIILLLEQKIHQTVMTINLSALRGNVAAFQRRLKPAVKTMAMVKASSYGNGDFEIANVLQQAQIDYLTVAYADEGVALRKANIKVPIMVMSPSTEAFDRMILWQLEPEIFNFRSLNHFIQVANRLVVKDYPIHLKVDTGMHRLGFVASEIAELINIITQHACLRIASIFSHLAASDDIAFAAFTHQQASAFNSMSQQIIEGIGYRPLLHLCNTAGIAMYPEYHYDMVRLGLGLYGIDSSNIINNQLEQISTLKTTIAQIKEVNAGDTIGYSRRGVVSRKTRIATICIGYADGLPRALSNGEAYVMINNKPAKLIGNIAMDMCMVDITDIDAVQEGDEAIVFGAALPIQQIAAWAGTIPYEIMTSIAQRVKRVYINEG
ncbi:MAG: bifunctional UDP-N-acetylmuramoyl-tripeptide:D-alanyl-D-alanine ligase/alanine racemase [Chitinophagaceae bacterium]|nr:bifunctional UDP-N-acetylmuramoyl-tripeptide:D-alanyl-D-alanine ligase/alanine racemase [Chitinophagaceae bacterium]